VPVSRENLVLDNYLMGKIYIVSNVTSSFVSNRTERLDIGDSI
jgi:hypothetical protein